MTEWLGYSIPWWAWISVGGGIVALVWYSFGPRAALAAFAGVILILTDRRARQAGWKANEERQKQREKEFVDDFRNQQSKARSRTEHDLDRRNNRWLRK